MNESTTSERSGPERTSGADTDRDVAGRGRSFLSTAAPSIRRGFESGAVTAIVGGVGVLGGLRAFLGGERRRGLARIVFGAVFLGAALVQRRSRDGGQPDVEEIDVADTGPDVGESDDAGGVDEGDHATGEAAAAVADTSPDLEDAGSGLGSESDADEEPAQVDQRAVADRPEDDVEFDRLGEAAFDRQSREVPAPQRAFNQGFLAHSAEAFWGIREGDDAVLVSLDFDAVEDRDGVRYVASSEIGEDVRELPIPNAILDHWDDVIGGGTAVAGGDDVLFVTTDDLSADHLLRVLPAEWADDTSG